MKNACLTNMISHAKKFGLLHTTFVDTKRKGGKAGKAMHEKHVVAGIHEMKRCQNLAILVDTRRKGGKAGKALARQS